MMTAPASERGMARRGAEDGVVECVRGMVISLVEWVNRVGGVPLRFVG